MPDKTTPQPDDLRNPYGYSEMDWAAQLDPAYAAARAEVRRLSVGEDGALTVKVKEFVVLGVLASRGLQYGVEAHMRRALAHGATKDELFEAIKAAAVPGGGVAYSVGVRALQASRMRENHTSGTVQGVPGNRHSYCDILTLVRALTEAALSCLRVWHITLVQHAVSCAFDSITYRTINRLRL
jgi:AhpD family alkylhydroperoxidase